jgi:hypothetical protein
VLLLTPVVAEVIDGAPFEIDLPIPDDAVGSIELLAVGIDAAGDFTSSASIHLTVVPPAPLTGVTIVNRDPILFVGESRRIGVLGSYADGIVRDLSGDSAGTEYLTSAPGFFTVSAGGVVSATGEGIATLVARNGGFQDSVTVTVREALGDVTPPEIESLTADPAVLWPPNHKMRAVALAVAATDDSGEEPSCEITAVASDEPVTGPGDNTSPDWQVTGPLALDLRAERLGAGDGRTYTIDVTCFDAAGNESTANVEVLVPHDRRN